MPSPCRSPVSRSIAAASWHAVIASSNRRTSTSAAPRLVSAMPSLCRSPVSRSIAAASWHAVIASSNRRTSTQRPAQVVSATASFTRLPWRWAASRLICSTAIQSSNRRRQDKYSLKAQRQIHGDLVPAGAGGQDDRGDQVGPLGI